MCPLTQMRCLKCLGSFSQQFSTWVKKIELLSTLTYHLQKTTCQAWNQQAFLKAFPSHTSFTENLISIEKTLPLIPTPNPSPSLTISVFKHILKPYPLLCLLISLRLMSATSASSLHFCKTQWYLFLTSYNLPHSSPVILKCKVDNTPLRLKPADLWIKSKELTICKSAGVLVPACLTSSRIPLAPPVPKQTRAPFPALNKPGTLLLPGPYTYFCLCPESSFPHSQQNRFLPILRFQIKYHLPWDIFPHQSN